MFFLFTLLFDNKILDKSLIFNSIIDFSYIRSKFNLLIGNNKNNQFVSSEKFIYQDIEKINNSYLLKVDNNYVIKNIKSGTITFIGNLENLGNTIIVNTDDGTNIYYSNLDNINVNLYDYIKEGTILGSVNNYIYLTFEKNHEYLSYENYI